jgi:catechol 2,3-dioxygenase-like lactoylglutathione lyase family enzyme
METSESSPMTAVRVARPSRNYDAVVAFYRDLLGFPVVASFAAHDGYAGTVFGLPDRRFQLEVTQHVGGLPLPTPTSEDLLVVYYADETSRAAVENRLENSDVAPASLENPYWAKVGARGYVDPDGWVVVLARATRMP